MRCCVATGALTGSTSRCFPFKGKKLALGGTGAWSRAGVREFHANSRGPVFPDGVLIRRCGQALRLPSGTSLSLSVVDVPVVGLWVRIVILVALSHLLCRDGLPREQLPLFSGFYVAHCS